MILAFSFATNPPVYTYWARRDLVPADYNSVGSGISTYIWNQLFPGFLAFALVLFTLVMGIVTLLRREE